MLAATIGVIVTVLALRLTIFEAARLKSTPSDPPAWERSARIAWIQVDLYGNHSQVFAVRAYRPECHAIETSIVIDDDGRAESSVIKASVYVPFATAGAPTTSEDRAAL